MSKKKSYENINYNLRPAKSIERKMLCDAFRRLNEFTLTEKYKYVGFGSTFFSDFVLLHRALGIRKMISVEHDIDNEERFRFNVPFNCIEWIPGTSNEVLPDLDWEEESIVWLDYDDSFNKDMIQDIKTLSANLISGSMLIISCNVHYKHGERINSMKRNLEDKMPEHLREEDLDGWNVAKETRNIILAEIKDTLLERNALKEDLEKIEFKQLFNFCYKDGAKMLTFGGLFCKKSDQDKFEKCDYDNLQFIKKSEEHFLIDVPSLTYKEIRALDTQLPCSDTTTLKLPGVKAKDIEKYAGFYRYFPNFAETEI